MLLRFQCFLSALSVKTFVVICFLTMALPFYRTSDLSTLFIVIHHCFSTSRQRAPTVVNLDSDGACLHCRLLPFFVLFFFFSLWIDRPPFCLYALRKNDKLKHAHPFKYASLFSLSLSLSARALSLRARSLSLSALSISTVFIPLSARKGVCA